MDKLKQLKDRLFMLEMADRWEAEDYKIANELRREIKELESSLNDKN